MGGNMAEQKLGLALSGGGFRASLFHIGVLARLVELRILPRVQVLSTVSGGSIVGAYYYLKIKELLEGRRSDFPQNPTQQSLDSYLEQAYISIVREIEKEFLAAVQKNLRTRALWNPFKNARMFLSDDYSRSDRMAELYNEHFYLPLWRRMMGDADARLIHLRDIAISPVKLLQDAVGISGSFNIRTYNREAKHKIPVLTINATTLNTGHPWHFTGAWVGEPRPQQPSNDTNVTIDTNVTLEQLSFDGWDRNQKRKRPPLENAGNEKKRAAKLDDLTLADAVAASACVPGIFSPMAIHDLYWNSSGEEIVVELVDGGVHDNQGTDALFQDNCTEIICSDASGQLEDERTPSSKLVPVVRRSNDILMDRVRDDGYLNLYQSERGDELLDEHDPLKKGNALEKELRERWNVNRFAFFHLREMFSARPGYPGIPGPVDCSTEAGGHVYRLSNVRTDLDSFSDIEAFTLMYDGYCLSNECVCRKFGTPSDLPKRGRPDEWQFLQATVMLELRTVNAGRLRRLLRHLHIGKHQFFRAFLLPDPSSLFIAGILLAAAVAAAVAGWNQEILSIPAFSLTTGEAVAGAMVALFFFLLNKLQSTRWMAKVNDYVRVLRRGQMMFPLYWALGIVLIVVTALVTIHLCVFDKLFLRAGKVR
jgi:NTE family protein